MSFKTSKLHEIADVVDSLHKTPKYTDVGYPMVRCIDLGYGPIKLDNTYKVTDEVYAEYSRRYSPKKGDIIITRVGANFGVTSYVEDTEFCLGQNTAAIVPKINARYLYYVLNSKAGREQMSMAVAGAAQPTLSLKAINNLDVPRLGDKIEEEIAKIAGALDDKIQLNRHINQTLEQSALAIFKSWFIDFEPVKAKIQAKQNGQDPERAAMRAISGKSDVEIDLINPTYCQQLATTALLFPDEMEVTEFGEVPNGWGAVKYNELYTEKKEKVKGREDVCVLSAVQSGELKLPIDVFEKQVHSKDISKYKIVNIGDLAYNPSRINIGSAGFNEFDFVGAVSPVYTVMGLKNQKYGSFARMHLRLGITKEWINILCSGSVRQSLSVDDFLMIPVVIPSADLNDNFSNIYQSFEELISRNKEENKTLESIRDSLLPKLLSGEITLSDSQSSAEAVAV